MARLLRTQRTWLITLALLAATAGVIVSLLVLAGPNDVSFTATLYSDVIRFEADGVASLRVTIYDLSENELWSSGSILGGFVDWDRTNERGERLANGYYLYLAQGWDASDRLILNKTGKVVLLPGDQVELRAAPIVSGTGQDRPISEDRGSPLFPMAYDVAGDFTIGGSLGIGTDAPARPLHLVKTLTGVGPDFGGGISSTFDPSGAAGTLGSLAVAAVVSGSNSQGISGLYGGILNVEHYGSGAITAATGFQGKVNNRSSGSIGMAKGIFSVVQNLGSGTLTDGYGLYVQQPYNTGGGTFQNFYGVYIENPTAANNNWAVFAGGGKSYFGGDVGIGTSGPAAKLHVSGDTIVGGDLGVGTTNVTDVLTIEAGSGNLIACYPGASRAAGAAVFRVEADGDVYADGTVYSLATAVGSADVAERINVSEWVEAGDVVEIDPEHVGFFRRATEAYSRRVAGIISTSPGVILGNDIDSTSDEWNDNRPVLAIAGRVPVKVSTENGPIAVGDLLVSSSVPGIAMKGDPAVSIGAVVGKAMEALGNGEGIIMTQVTLR